MVQCLGQRRSLRLFGVLSMLILVTGCGADAGLSVSTDQPGGGSGPAVFGVVELPGGQLASAPSLWQRLAAVATSRVDALTGDVSPAADVVVQLAQLIHDDVINGSDPVVLSQTRSDASGSYRIVVPEGSDENVCRFLVQVGNRENGTLTRAFVFSIDEPVDINFNSEAAVRLILRQVPPATLCDFDPQEIREIYETIVAAPGSVVGSTASEVNAVATTLAASDPDVQAAIEAAIPTPTRTASATPTPVPGSPTPTSVPGTSTPTGLPTDTPRSTATSPPTATEEPGAPTRTPTSVPTSPPAATPTPTSMGPASPTPTQPVGGALGIRAFQIAMKPASAFFSTGAGGTDVSLNPWIEATLLIEGGEAGPDGTAPLTLVQDVIIGYKVLDQSTVCTKLFAAGSSGSIDCDGGSGHNVELTVNSNGMNPEDPPVLVTGLGADSGAGAATLLVMENTVNLAAGTSVGDCADVEFGEPGQAAFTTAMTTATVNNARQGGTVTLTKTGVNFSCGGWITQMPLGTLVSPLLGLDTIVGDSAQIVQLGEQESEAPPPVPTPTPPAPPTATLPAQPTATPTTGAGGNLGQRAFQIALKPASAFFSSGLAGGDVSANPWTPSTLLLNGGAVGPDGVAPVTLAEDVIYGFKVIDGSTICTKLFAAGSTGSVDCDGGSGHDVELSVNSNGTNPEDPPVLVTGIGSDSGPGAMTLEVMQATENLPAGTTVDACASVEFGEPSQTAFTTAQATTTVTNARQGGTTVLSKTGMNFSCDGWVTRQPLGRLVSPVLGLDTVIGDSSQVVQLGEQ